MTRLNTQRGQQRHKPHQLLAAGIAAFVAGVALLFIPVLDGALRPVGSLVLLVGVVLLVLHLVWARLVDARQPHPLRSDSSFSSNSFVYSGPTGHTTQPLDDQ